LAGFMLSVLYMKGVAGASPATSARMEAHALADLTEHANRSRFTDPMH
jgi:hypothetical protein